MILSYQRIFKRYLRFYDSKAREGTFPSFFLYVKWSVRLSLCCQKYYAEEGQVLFIIPAQRGNLREREAEGTLSLFLQLIIWTHGDNGFGLCPCIAYKKCSAGIIATQFVPVQKNIWQHSNRTSLYSVIYLPRQGRKEPLLSPFSKTRF